MRSIHILSGVMLAMLCGVAVSAQEHAHNHDEHKGHVDEVHLTAEAIRHYGIKFEAVKKHVLRQTFVAPARISFNDEAMAHVGSALTGRVVEIKVRLGDQVKKGDELLIIESPELAEAQSDYLLKRTEIDVANVAVEPARQAHDRARTLHEKDQGIALAEVQKREAEWRSATARHSAARGALTAAENKLRILGMNQAAIDKLGQSGEISSRTAIHAPIAGQVIDREVTLGELVNPDRDALLVLADLTTLWVIAEVPEARLADVAVGSASRIQVVSSRQDSLEGKVTYIAPSLNEQTRTVSVRIEVAGSGGLRAGMFASVEIAAGAQGDEAVLAIPDQAVQTVEGDPAVFVPVEGEPNTFAKRQVGIGPVIGGMVQVFAGLKEGEKYISVGSFILKAELGKAGAAHEH